MTERILLSKEEREQIVATTTYEWEKCFRCGRCEKEYFLEHGWSMLLWHIEDGRALCEYCYPEYEDEQE